MRKAKYIPSLFRINYEKSRIISEQKKFLDKRPNKKIDAIVILPSDNII